jgi:serine/threonine-protein kinase RsbW
MLHADTRTSMSQYRITLPPSIDHCLQLRQCIGAVARIEGYSDAFVSVLELTVHEIFVNAVIHANQDDADLPVVLMLEAGGGDGERYLEVRVRDFGEGFEAERTIAAICSSRTGASPGGRGLFLVNHFVKSFRIEKLEDGCVVVLRYIPY